MFWKSADDCSSLCSLGFLHFKRKITIYQPRYHTQVMTATKIGSKDKPTD